MRRVASEHVTAHTAPVNATIRALRPADVLAAVDLLVLAAGGDKRHRLLDQLAHTEPGDLHHAVVAERSGVIVGAGKLTAEPAFPGTISALVAVAQGDRGRGSAPRSPPSWPAGPSVISARSTC
ncbi:hypothetical protein GCM10027614_72080 [Micromonospora vulcania]